VIRDTVYWPGEVPRSPTARERATLVHELAHCWQHRTGRRQLSRGIVEQTLFTLFGWWLVRLGLRPLYDPYDYGGAAGAAAAEHLDRFRLEAQASVIEHHFLASVEGAAGIRGERLRAPDGSPTAYARDLARLCAAVGLPGRAPDGGNHERSDTMSYRSAELARGWIEAWIRMDMDWLRERLAADFVHVSPFGRLAGREHYLATVEPLARKSVQKLTIRGVVASGDQAAIRFENTTPAGVVDSCDWIRVEGDRIAEIRSFYDTSAVREVLSGDEQERLGDAGEPRA
jgi:ketosteroid isomerase-like protein